MITFNCVAVTETGRDGLRKQTEVMFDVHTAALPRVGDTMRGGQLNSLRWEDLYADGKHRSHFLRWRVTAVEFAIEWSTALISVRVEQEMAPCAATPP